jgi:hypothetical protein
MGGAGKRAVRRAAQLPELIRRVLDTPDVITGSLGGTGISA